MNLPEERLRLGKVTPFGSAPVMLHPDDNRTSRMTDEAKRVLFRQGFFSTRDLHELMARVWLDG